VESASLCRRRNLASQPDAKCSGSAQQSCLCVCCAATSPSHPKQKVKAPVPLRTEKPIMGLTSNKNYITSNASKSTALGQQAGLAGMTVL
jgi:hypothetical protein